MNTDEGYTSTETLSEVKAKTISKLKTGKVSRTVLDKLLLDFVRATGHPEVADAYEDACIRSTQ